MTEGSPDMISQYVSKYLTKEQEHEWKTRISRDLGLRRIRRYLTDRQNLQRALQQPRITSRALKLSKPLIDRLASRALTEGMSDEDLLKTASRTPKMPSVWAIAKQMLPMMDSPYNHTSTGHYYARREADSKLAEITAMGATVQMDLIREEAQHLRRYDKTLWRDLGYGRGEHEQQKSK